MNMFHSVGTAEYGCTAESGSMEKEQTMQD
jgi:hypothetical protein